MKRNITIYTLLCVLFLGTLSCKDDMPYGYGEIGEGECMISGTVKFKSFTPALSVNTRAVGDAIKEINSLCVLLYNESQNLQEKHLLTPGTEAGEGVFVVNKNVPRTNGTGSAGETGEIAESYTPQAKFQLTVPYGKYYIYAVANMGNLSGHEDAIQTVKGLKSISLQWNKDDVSKNCQMFGHFFSASNTDEAPLLVINGATRKLQAWVRRAASKVTVAFDGTRLADGVSIYIKSVAIKDIPTMCYLGKDSKIVKGAENTADNYGDLIADGESLAYGTGEAHNAWPTITNTASYCYYDKDNKKGTVVAGYDSSQEAKYAAKAHDEYNDALFFYENMQGEGMDKSQKDEDGDGKPDSKPEKDGKPYGTYIEVEAYYNSENPECLGSGDIKYRFMLGKNTTTNYDAERNHHYKLTLIFNRFANDPDWHIYKERYFGVTQPKVMNYQGYYFMPDKTIPNRGHIFSNQNIITVTSFDEFTETGEKAPVEWAVTYREEGQTEFSESCDWLTYTEPTDEQKKLLEIPVVFTASIDQPDVKTININNNLTNALEKGRNTPYNLANPGGAANTVQNTANCYIVDAKGSYIFPLVYGNAIENGSMNDKSYTYNGAGENILPYFKNHLNNNITDPYIINNTGCSPSKVEVVWQDEENLVSNIQYDRTAYGNMGGIQFDVTNPREGNAVIAIKDDKERVMWSWHIWVTNFTGLEETDETIEVTNHDKRKFKFLPVNLGWCSNGESFKYYREQRCEVKFTARGNFKEQTVTFIKKSHIAFPRGNNPYYQWGRKDPFVGSNGSWTNKRWYDYCGWWSTENPTRFYDEFQQNEVGVTTPGKFPGEERKSTRDILNLLIQYPGIWHNPPREGHTIVNGKDTTRYYTSANKTYANLWEGNVINDVFTYKTVYDPCPVGYQVSPFEAFTGFTAYGDNANASNEWYDVQITNIAEGNPTEGLYEFYTNTEKLQSIIFPESGYRDWDASAGVIDFNAPSKGYAWTVRNLDDNSSYFLDFSRTKDGGFIRPKDTFYSCDGFPIRPCVQDTTRHHSAL